MLTANETYHGSAAHGDTVVRSTMVIAITNEYVLDSTRGTLDAGVVLARADVPFSIILDVHLPAGLYKT